MIKKDPKMALTEIRHIMEISSGNHVFFKTSMAEGTVRSVRCSITWVRSGSGVGWTEATTC